MDLAERLYAIRPLQWDLDDSHWPILAGTPMVFIEQYLLPEQHDIGVLAGARLYLFGGPIQHDSESYHVEYNLLEQRRSGELFLHHLAQRDTSTDYLSASAADDYRARERQPDLNDKEIWEFGTKVAQTAQKAVRVFFQNCDYDDALWSEYVHAGKPKGINGWVRACVDRDFRCISRRPRWISEGHWPTFRGKPMIFISQTAQRDTERTRKRIGGDEMLYLFAAVEGATVEFSIHIDFIGVQTAEQHYALEELMDEFLRNPRDVDLIRRCIKKGGRYMQEFMLEQRRLSPTALKLISTEGANKELRDAAATRLNSGH